MSTPVTTNQQDVLDANIEVFSDIVYDLLAEKPEWICQHAYELLWQGIFLDSYMHVVIVNKIPNQLFSFCSDNNSDAVISNCIDIANTYTTEEFNAAIDGLKERATACRVSLAEAIREQLRQAGISVTH